MSTTGSEQESFSAFARATKYVKPKQSRHDVGEVLCVLFCTRNMKKKNAWIKRDLTRLYHLGCDLTFIIYLFCFV